MLTKWGGALLELSQFRQGADAYSMIEEAIEKFQKALKIDEERHDALWCLGNAYTTQGFLSPDAPAAHSLFTQAADCFKKAVEIAPANETYKRSLEMTAKAPVLYQELQRQLIASGHIPAPEGEEGPAPSGAAAARSPRARQATAKAPGISDFWYDVGGWATLLAIGFGVAALAQRGAPATA